MCSICFIKFDDCEEAKLRVKRRENVILLSARRLNGAREHGIRSPSETRAGAASFEWSGTQEEVLIEDVRTPRGSRVQEEDVRALEL